MFSVLLGDFLYPGAP